MGCILWIWHYLQNNRRLRQYIAMELILLLTWDPVGNVCTRHKSTQGETVCKVTNTNRPTTFRSHKSIQLGLVWHRVYEKCIWTIILVACLASEWPLYGTKHAHCALAMCRYAFFVQICATSMIFKIYCQGAVSVLVWWWNPMVDANSRRVVVVKLGSEWK